MPSRRVRAPAPASRAAPITGEGQRRHGEQLPEPRPCVLRIREPVVSQHVVVTAEEHGELHDDEGEKERVEERQRDHPFGPREAAQRARLTRLASEPRAPSPSPSAADRTRTSVADPPGQRRSGRQRQIAREARERGVRREEEQPNGSRSNRAERGSRATTGAQRVDGLGVTAGDAAAAPRTGAASAARAVPPAARLASTQAAARSSQTTQLASSSAACAASAQREHAEDEPQARDAKPVAGREQHQRGDDRNGDPQSLSGQECRGDERRGEREAPHSGSSTIIRHPFGVRSSVRIVPSWSSTIQRAIASPRPLPPSPLERAWSER